MTIEERDHADGKTRPAMTACPYCGVAFDREENPVRYHLPCDGVPDTEEVTDR